MSFTIAKTAQFPPLKQTVVWAGSDKDDGTIKSAKSRKSTIEIIEVSLALTMATFKSKMTEIINQLREDAREERKADLEEDRAHEDRTNKRREVEQGEDRKVRAEERKET